MEFDIVREMISLYFIVSCFSSLWLTDEAKPEILFFKCNLLDMPLEKSDYTFVLFGTILYLGFMTIPTELKL